MIVHNFGRNVKRVNLNGGLRVRVCVESDVMYVLLNMWAHDIGCYSAANYDLFETVFAHSVALRRAGGIRSQRTVSTLIVGRDHAGEAAASDIRGVAMGGLNSIWDCVIIHSQKCLC